MADTHVCSKHNDNVVCMCCVCRSDSENVEDCTSSKISENATFPSPWGWLKEGAHFEEYHEQGTNKTYASWKLHVSSWGKQGCFVALS